MVRTFWLQRVVDVSGVSGTGRVAEGCEFEDGTTVIRWRGQQRSTVVWDSIQDAIDVHGHDGKTRFVYDA